MANIEEFENQENKDEEPIREFKDIFSAKEIIAGGKKDIPCLWEPFLPKKGVAALVGSSDVGKSHFLLQLAIAIAYKDDEFLGFKLNTGSGNVIYITTEDDETSLNPRICNLTKERKSQDPLEKIMFFTNSQYLDKLDGIVKGIQFDAVIIDTFLDIYDGDLIQANKVRHFLLRYKDMAASTNTLFIFNHHCTKRNEEKPPHKDNVMGSQGFEASVRYLLELRRDPNDIDFRHLCALKANYVGDQYKSASYKLEYTFEDGFKETTERADFETLVINPWKKPKDYTMIDANIKRLYPTHKTCRGIHNALKAEGINSSKSTIADRIKALGLGKEEK